VDGVQKFVKIANDVVQAVDDIKSLYKNVVSKKQGRCVPKKSLSTSNQKLLNNIFIPQ
jgi:hypothetical protein